MPRLRDHSLSRSPNPIFAIDAVKSSMPWTCAPFGKTGNGHFWYFCFSTLWENLTEKIISDCTPGETDMRTRGTLWGRETYHSPWNRRKLGWFGRKKPAN